MSEEKVQAKVKAAVLQACLESSPAHPVDVRKYGLTLDEAEGYYTEEKEKVGTGFQSTDVIYLTDGETYLELQGNSRTSRSHQDILG